MASVALLFCYEPASDNRSAMTKTSGCRNEDQFINVSLSGSHNISAHQFLYAADWEYGQII